VDVHVLRAEPISITYACHDPIYVHPRPLLLGSFGPSSASPAFPSADYLRGAAAGGEEVGEGGGDGLVVVQTDTDTNSSVPATSLKQVHFVAPPPAHAQVTKEQEAEEAMNEKKEKEQRWPPTPAQTLISNNSSVHD